MGTILLQGGTVLAHEGDRVKVLCNHDILIVGNRIEDIGQGLTLPDRSAVRVIDCQGKIVSPGFIDTHHHLWQSQVHFSGFVNFYLILQLLIFCPTI
jgi:cytosine/adenosine deaminase-related metal-dependent hydrolase